MTDNPNPSTEDWVALFPERVYYGKIQKAVGRLLKYEHRRDREKSKRRHEGRPSDDWEKMVSRATFRLILAANEASLGLRQADVDREKSASIRNEDLWYLLSTCQAAC